MNDTNRQSAIKRSFRLQGFQLDEHPRSMAAVVLFLLLASYSFVDMFLTAESGYVSVPPYGLFALAGGFVGLPIFVWLHRGAVPRVEAAGVAVMVGLACAAAAYPGLLRISDLSGAAPYEPRTYRLADGLILQPLDVALPPLHAPLDRHYWSEQPVGEQWTLEMRQGLLGIWMYRIKPLHDKIEAYQTRKALIQGLTQLLGAPREER